MITCPNCNHQNPEGSVQCESCYTPLSSTSPCPNCGAVVQTDATFCGQCGFNLQGKINISQTASGFYRENLPNSSQNEAYTPFATNAEISQSPWDLADEEDEQLLSYSDEELTQSPMSSLEDLEKELEQPSMTPFGEVGEFDELPSNLEETEDLESWITSVKEESFQEDNIDAPEEIPELSTSQELESIRSNLSEDAANLGLSVSEPEPEIEPEIEPEPSTPQSTAPDDSSQSLVTNDVITKLQLQQAVLLHLQTGNNIMIPSDLAVVHIGKPNKQIPPDIDVSSFPNSEIVSRIHAEIRIEGDSYFLEDRDSSNGTYINHSPLLVGNRHRLRTGDRISLGKGDLMTLIFQLN
jgi:hypothetical protein